MEENNLTMADLMAEVDKSMARIYRGQVIEATVILVQEKGVSVNIGSQKDGFIPWDEMSFEAVDKDSVKEGDKFNVVVVKIDDEEVIVSKRRAEIQKTFDEVQKMFENKETFTVHVKEVVKGGVVAPFKGLRGFIPGSQISHTYVEDLSAYVGKEVEVEIIEFDPKAKKLVLSGKRLSANKAKSAKAEKLATLVAGERVTGTVTKLMPYGAFVDLGGVEGLVHNNELSWTRIKHPSDVVKEGDKIDVVISSVDTEAGKIALSLKDITVDPWVLETANLEKDQVLNVTITRFASFGAFAKISEHVEGLIHISQISEKRINKAEEVLEIGQEVKAKIVNIDKATKKIGLTLKDVEAQMNDDMAKYMQTEDEKVTIGDVL